LRRKSSLTPLSLLITLETVATEMPVALAMDAIFIKMGRVAQVGIGPRCLCLGIFAESYETVKWFYRNYFHGG
jgi:hypothetical protein